MRGKTTVAVVALLTFVCLLSISEVAGRARGGIKNHHHSSHHHQSQSELNTKSHNHHGKVTPVRRPQDDEYDYDDDGGGGRHAYLMSSDTQKPHDRTERLDSEDQALSQAFEQHMRPSNKNAKNTHDVYAYQLPSDLWFIVRYHKNAEGQVEKYMSIVDSFTNYLDKLEEGVKSVSVNVKGVETIFRLTTKHKSSS